MFPLIKALHSTCSLQHHRLQNSLTTVSFLHLVQSICEGSLYFGPFEIIERILESEMIFKIPMIILPAGS